MRYPGYTGMLLATLVGLAAASLASAASAADMRHDDQGKPRHAMHRHAPMHEHGDATGMHAKMMHHHQGMKMHGAMTAMHHKMHQHHHAMMIRGHGDMHAMMRTHHHGHMHMAKASGRPMRLAGLAPSKPAGSCGTYMYWKAGKCLDARNQPPKG